MPREKHLVLDYHVHQLLVGMRKKTGLPMRRIGNTILRCSLRSWGTLHRLLGAALREVAGVNESQFEEAISIAFEHLRDTALLDDEFHSGSTPSTEWKGWAIRTLDGGTRGGSRILEYTLTSKRLQSMPQHHHDENVHLLSLNGHVLVSIGGTQQILFPNQSVDIRAGVVHSLEPLASDVRLLATFTNHVGASLG